MKSKRLRSGSRRRSRSRPIGIGIGLGALALTQCVGEPPRFDDPQLEGGRAGSDDASSAPSAGTGRGAGGPGGVSGATGVGGALALGGSGSGGQAGRRSDVGSNGGTTSGGAGGTMAGAAGQLASDAGGAPAGSGSVEAGATFAGHAGEAGKPGGLQRCDPTAPFVRVENVSELNDEYFADSARLSFDQLRVYFSYVREGTGEPFEAHFAEREGTTEAFLRPSSLPLLPSASGPTVSKDGSLMVYGVDEGAEGPNLYLARLPFSVETSERLEATRSDDWEYAPYLSADDTELFFVRRPSDGELNTNDHELWVAPRSGEAFGAPVALDELNLPGVAERSPALSADGLRLYFASNRPASSGAEDIYVATRDRVGARFGEPVPVAELNTVFNDRPNWISPDECTLYFASDRPGGEGRFDVWRAERDRSE